MLVIGHIYELKFMIYEQGGRFRYRFQPRNSLIRLFRLQNQEATASSFL